MNKKKHIAFGKQLYITKGESPEYVYLCEVSQKNVRDMTVTQRESVPQEEDAYELVLYDIDGLDDYQGALEPKFTDSAFIRKGFAMNNRIYEQGLYLDSRLNLLGPVFHDDRQNFCFVRSSAKSEGSISP